MIWWHIESSPPCSLLQQCSLYWMPVYIRCAALSLKTGRYWQCCRASLSICVRFLPCNNNTEQITQPCSPFLSGLLFSQVSHFPWLNGVPIRWGEKERKIREAGFCYHTQNSSTQYLIVFSIVFILILLISFLYFTHFLFDLLAGRHFRPFALCVQYTPWTHTHTYSNWNGLYNSAIVGVVYNYNRLSHKGWEKEVTETFRTAMRWIFGSLMRILTQLFDSELHMFFSFFLILFL